MVWLCKQTFLVSPWESAHTKLCYFAEKCHSVISRRGAAYIETWNDINVFYSISVNAVSVQYRLASSGIKTFSLELWISDQKWKAQAKSTMSFTAVAIEAEWYRKIIQFEICRKLLWWQVNVWFLFVLFNADKLQMIILIETTFSCRPCI